MTFEQITNVMVDLQPDTLIIAYNVKQAPLYRNKTVEQVLQSGHKNDKIICIGILQAHVENGFIEYATRVSICVEEQ